MAWTEVAREIGHSIGASMVISCGFAAFSGAFASFAQPFATFALRFFKAQRRP
jgi:hypothetical protein